VQNIGSIDVTIDMGIEIHAIITRESVEKLGLRSGKTCRVYFKATAVKFIKK
jgi:molybdopterin-binding protein